MAKKKLSSEQHKEFLKTLKTRFEKNMKRHKGLDWAAIQTKLEANAEKLLWQELRNKKLNGLKFRRQHPIDKWIADFYCHEKKLVIELDGEVHNDFEAKERDGGGTYELEQLGITVVRFTNDEIINNIEKALETINETVNILKD